MVNKVCKKYSAVLLFAAVLILSPIKAFSLTASEITESMTCICGCNMVVAACEGSMECGPAAQITSETVHLISEGKTKEEILQYFVDKNGEAILAAPTKQGFNFIAWVLPFLGLFVGIGGIYIFIDRALTSRLIHEEDEEPIESYSEEDRQYLEQIKDELDSYEM